MFASKNKIKKIILNYLISESTSDKALKEQLEKIDFYKKYTYGLDYIDDKEKESYDKIIGHTWLTHVKRKDSALDEVGEVLWHSLDESGHIAIYDVQWPSGNIETNIPAILLEKVKDSDDIDEAHEAHGIKGHRIDSSIDERKYKKKRKKSKKKKKSKNKISLFPYVFGGWNYHDHENNDFFDAGDFGGDGGGE